MLYVDEINLLSDLVVDALLDAAAQGVVHVKRGQHAIDYPSRFTLIGTMNPEEGELRPQITDRIGLRVFVRRRPTFEERLEIYRRNARFARDPRRLRRECARETDACAEAGSPRCGRRFDVVSSPKRRRSRSKRSRGLGIDSIAPSSSRWKAPPRSPRGKAATAGAADVARVLPLAARLRRSRLRVEAQSEHLAEDAAIAAALEATPAMRPPNDRATTATSRRRR